MSKCAKDGHFCYEMTSKGSQLAGGWAPVSTSWPGVYPIGKVKDPGDEPKIVGFVGPIIAPEFVKSHGKFSWKMRKRLWKRDILISWNAMMIHDLTKIILWLCFIRLPELMFGALKSFHTVCMDLVKVSPKQMVQEAGTKFRFMAI